MNEKLPILSENIDVDRSVIVVSDLHLGGTEDPHTSARFSRFLGYVSGLYPGSESKSVYDLKRDTHKLLPPQKIILLGDFFDLWDPRNQDKNNNLLDTIIPIAQLAEMDCDVVFVTGNHDEDIGELVNLQRRIENNVRSDPCRKKPDPCEKGTGTSPNETDQLQKKSIRYIPPASKDSLDGGLDFQIRPGRKVSVSQRSYIPGPEREGLDIGGVTYAFLHGQQFDPEQITYWMSKKLKKRVDPVSVIVDYANTDPAKSISLWHSILFLGMWVIALIFSNWPSTESFDLAFGAFIGGIVFFIITMLVFIYCNMYEAATKGDDSSRLFWCTLVIFTIIIMFLITGTYVESLDILFSIAVWMLTFITVVISIPKIIASVKRGFYNLIKAQNKTIEQIAGPDEKGRYRYFRPDDFDLSANVVIFGHTECAGYMPYTIPAAIERPSKEIYLINSGCWVRTTSVKELSSFKRYLTRGKDILLHGWDYLPQPRNQDPCKEHLDTFVYIDTYGARLMKWRDDDVNDPIKEIFHATLEILPH